MLDDRYLDYIMINIANTLKEYCDDSVCIDCPFAHNTDENKRNCIIGMPAYWDLKGVKKNEKI